MPASTLQRHVGSWCPPVPLQRYGGSWCLHLGMKQVSLTNRCPQDVSSAAPVVEYQIVFFVRQKGNLPSVYVCQGSFTALVRRTQVQHAFHQHWHARNGMVSSVFLSEQNQKPSCNFTKEGTCTTSPATRHHKCVN